jgi:hypothetical protein
MDNDLQAVRDLVDGADLADGVRLATKPYLDRLPGLYRDLALTYDVRCRQEIAGVVQRLVSYLGQPAVREAVTDRLRAMQERLGIPGPDFRPAPPAPSKPRKRKAG